MISRAPVAALPSNAGVDTLTAITHMRKSGRFDHRIKVKNRKHPAFSRVMDTFG
jgi:hypothetical protein